MNVYIQPTGKFSRKDFIDNEWVSWAEKENYHHIWKIMKDGDFILFTQSNMIFAVAEVVGIAKDYEGSVEYPLRYEFKIIEIVDIPVLKINPILGYKENYIWRQFTRLTSQKSGDILDFIENEIKPK